MSDFNGVFTMDKDKVQKKLDELPDFFRWVIRGGAVDSCCNSDVDTYLYRKRVDLYRLRFENGFRSAFGRIQKIVEVGNYTM